MNKKREIYQTSIEDALKTLQATNFGLTTKEAKKRLGIYGLNEIKETKKLNLLNIFFSQFKSILILVLIVAIIVSLAISLIEKTEYLDPIIIAVIVLLNASLGTIQEYKAEKALMLLKKLNILKVNVLRDNKSIEIFSQYIVPGDIILVEAGSKIPADARIIEAFNVQTDEALLTGESVPVEKISDTITKTVQIGDQKNVLFAGTTMVGGKTKAVVVKTGMSTELGKVAEMVSKIEKEHTPLQKQLNKLGKHLALIVTIVSIAVFFAGSLITKQNTIELLLTAVALAVAAVPEGLPAVVTIVLAVSVQRLVKKNVLIRKLTSTETLGCVTVICSDKTGTITEGKMSVRRLFFNKKEITVTNEPVVRFFHEEKQLQSKELEQPLRIARLCNDAILPKTGDPTELALLVVSSPFTKDYERLDEVPFDQKEKWMATLNKVNEQKIVHIKGAPEIVIARCTKIFLNGKEIKFTRELKENMLRENEILASNALRVLALAYSKTNSLKELKKKEWVFSALIGMIDPPRKEVKRAILVNQGAGIKDIMITGDHPLTAKAIAKEIGLSDGILTGEELDKLSDKQFEKVVEGIAIYARVTPQHKVRILDALKKKGNIAAMTGDGVNDAPALKKADIGIAVNAGTDISKEASDMVLLDNNFASISKAIEEGRLIYSNIKKFTTYLLTANIGEILLIFIAILLNLPLPLLPIQILWLNLLTDGLPALALGRSTETGLMLLKPRKRRESILKGSVAFLIFGGFLSFFSGLVPFLFLKSLDLTIARTAALTSMVFFELLIALNRDSKEFFFKKTNYYLLAAISLTALLQIVTLYYQPLLPFFKTAPLALEHWKLIFLTILPAFILLEASKLIKNK